MAWLFQISCQQLAGNYKAGLKWPPLMSCLMFLKWFLCLLSSRLIENPTEKEYHRKGKVDKSYWKVAFLEIWKYCKWLFDQTGQSKAQIKIKLCSLILCKFCHYWNIKQRFKSYMAVFYCANWKFSTFLQYKTKIKINMWCAIARSCNCCNLKQRCKSNYAV